MRLYMKGNIVNYHGREFEIVRLVQNSSSVVVVLEGGCNKICVPIEDLEKEIENE